MHAGVALFIDDSFVESSSGLARGVETGATAGYIRSTHQYTALQLNRFIPRFSHDAFGVFRA